MMVQKGRCRQCSTCRRRWFGKVGADSVVGDVDDDSKVGVDSVVSNVDDGSAILQTA
jgi:hypothetical protein